MILEWFLISLRETHSTKIYDIVCIASCWYLQNASNSIATSTGYRDKIAKWQQSDRDYNLSRIGFIASSKQKSFRFQLAFPGESPRRAAPRFAKQASRIGAPLAPQALLPPRTAPTRSDDFPLVFAWTCLPCSSRARTVLELGKFYYCPEGITARQ